MSPTLAQLIALRQPPASRRASRAARVARAPQPPRASELAYVADLRRLVGKFGAIVDEHVVSALPPGPPRADAIERRDVMAPDFVGKFRLVKHAIDGLVSDESLLPTVSRALDRTAKYSAGEIGRVLGIKFPSMADLRGTLSDFRAENISLIKSMAGDYVQRVGNVLEGTEGRRAEDIADELRYALGVTKSKADLIAVDQTLKLHATINEKRQQAVGVTEYTWTTSHDERVRPVHKALDGTRQSWDAPPVTDESGARAHPGKDVRCRCQAIPIIPEFDE